MPQIKHVFFDLDHTLWDFEKNSALSFESIFTEHTVPFSVEEFLHNYIPINLKYWKRYRLNEITKEELRYQRLKEAFDSVQFKATDHLINTIAELYILRLSEQKHLFDGSLEILNYLKAKYHLHIITNGFEEVQYKKMYNSGISNYFLTTTTSEDVMLKKPHPKVFQHALQKAKATTQESIMIGDNLEADIFGALDVGMDAIYFGNDTTFKGKRVEQLLELKKYL
ncbi:YjjG family noncanonical pyrimidine nucleotidase [Psychroflexus salis]|uniref:Noncanonical pyrimidine nucleotidase, YjjG family protein n=1 Tax=Psychroflexus salis TaxID=1526574 RepID=A0A916ZMT2_9FLAO|nr:YjjG family noncanonical pyrimidine nucleotidase [Psychroflexus salis]GGE04362.1 noncanonical pyrimidine nucleotidase, YjjG family protein [Psychroflexus salis]